MPEPVEDQTELAAALGRIPSGLFIITVRHEDQSTGMLASWVQQCSFQPPLITVAINQQRAVLDWLRIGTQFTVNVLAEGSRQLVSHFGKGFELNQPAFTGLEVHNDQSVPPILLSSHAYLVCQVVERVVTGDHVLLIGEVMAGRVLQSAHPAVHIRKSGLKY
jgi:flavin reductase (DIM6/NTAB) family NADH-FMN oxidoreductase RutF